MIARNTKTIQINGWIAETIFQLILSFSTKLFVNAESLLRWGKLEKQITFR
jgi:hypothetical protein